MAENSTLSQSLEERIRALGRRVEKNIARLNRKPTTPEEEAKQDALLQRLSAAFADDPKETTGGAIVVRVVEQQSGDAKNV